MHRSNIIFIALALARCGEASEPSPTPLLLRATGSDHGVIELGSSVETELSRAQSVHSWQFTLTAQAQVTLHTEASVAAQPGDREVDTVLVLQRIEGEQPRWLAQNDDVGRSRYSRIERTLPAGEYQAQVHGYTPKVRGRFAFVTACVGAGCPALQPGCFFGDTFSDLRTHPTLTVASELWIRSAEQLQNDVERTQVIVAVQQSSHTDVTTIEQAIAVVDQQEVRRLELHDADGRAYVAFEYGVGDNSYGAIFALGATPVLASIHDGDLLECASQP